MLHLKRLLFVATLLVTVTAAPLRGQAVEWEKLPPALRLPQLNTDEEILYFINGIQEHFPGLFAGAVNFDVNVIQLIRDHKRLVEELIDRYPEYESQFEGRQMAEIRLRPRREGIQVVGSRINPTAVATWQRKLSNTLNELDRSLPFDQAVLKAMDGVGAIAESKWDFDELKLRTTELYKPILDLRLDPEFVEFFRSTVSRARQVPEKIALIETELKARLDRLPPGGGANAMEAVAKLSQLLQQTKEASQLVGAFEAKKASLSQKEVDAQKRAEEELFWLAQLYSVVERKAPGKNLDRVHPLEKGLREFHAICSQLIDEDLETLADPDAHVEPMAKLQQTFQVPGQTPAQLKQKLVGGIGELNKYYAQQVRQVKTQIADGLVLREVPPWMGILRGLISGDCASKFSFPYPNDPNEHVMVAYGPDGEARGTVSATEVDFVELDGASKKKQRGLYLITMAGSKLTAGDTELMLRGISSLRHKLSWRPPLNQGVDRVLLPEKSRLPGLLNFAAVKGVYLDHEKSIKVQPESKPVSLAYRDRPIRLSIESFKSDMNSGSYDKTGENKKGVTLDLDAEPEKLREIEASLRWVSPLQSAQKKMTFDEMIRFALEQNALGRKDLVQALLATPTIKDRISSEVFAEAMAALDNGVTLPPAGQTAPHAVGQPNPHALAQKIPTLPVKAFMERARTHLRHLGLNPDEFADTHAAFYLGRLKAPDVLDKAELPTTAKMIAWDLKQNFRTPKIGWPKIAAHREALQSVEEFKPVMEKLDKDLNGQDETRALYAAYFYANHLFTQAKPNLERDRVAFRHLSPYFDTFDPGALLPIRFSVLPHSQSPDAASYRKRIDQNLLRQFERASFDQAMAWLPTLVQMSRLSPPVSGDDLAQLRNFFQVLKGRFVQGVHHQLPKEVGYTFEKIEEMDGLLELPELALEEPLKLSIRAVIQKKFRELLASSTVAPFEGRDPKWVEKWFPVAVEGFREAIAELPTVAALAKDELILKIHHLELGLEQLPRNSPEAQGAFTELKGQLYHFISTHFMPLVNPAQGLPSPQLWTDAARWVRKRENDHRVYADLAKALKKHAPKLFERFSGEEAVSASWFLNGTVSESWKKEQKLAQHALDRTTNNLTGWSDFIALHKYYSEKKLPDGVAKVEGKFPVVLSGIHNLYPLIHLTGANLLPKEFMEKLRDRILLRLAEDLPAEVVVEEEGEGLAGFSRRPSWENFQREYLPDLDVILSIPDRNERRKYLSEHYLKLFCEHWSQDLKAVQESGSKRENCAK